MTARLAAFIGAHSVQLPEHIRTLRTKLSIAFFALLLAACAAPQKFAANPAFMKTPSDQKPKKVLLLPPDIDVSEISAGGVTEKVEAWSKQARSNVEQSLRKVLGEKQIFRLIDLPKVSPNEKEVVDRYLGLYEVVGSDAFVFGRSPDPAWKHKSTNFDYTLGKGLRFLKQETGADAALFIVGSDQISSSGRKAAMVLSALVGVALPTGITFVSAGLVDLDTGNILWLNFDSGGGGWDIRKQDDTDKLVSNIFKDYPTSK